MFARLTIRIPPFHECGIRLVRLSYRSPLLLLVLIFLFPAPPLCILVISQSVFVRWSLRYWGIDVLNSIWLQALWGWICIMLADFIHMTVSTVHKIYSRSRDWLCLGYIRGQGILNAWSSFKSQCHTYHHWPSSTTCHLWVSFSIQSYEIESFWGWGTPRSR